MKRTQFARRIAGAIGIGALVLAALVIVQSPEAVAQQNGVNGAGGYEGPTYAKDVAAIFQDKCQVCHQPGSIAPFSLMTYESARMWAPMIKEKVADRIMPPWHINRTVGIQEFKNDRGLTAEQIATIVAWVDDGAPLGDPADMPPPREFPDTDGWRLAETMDREPDLIVPSEPYTLAAATMDKWFRPTTDTGLTEKRWVKAIEIRPVGLETRAIVHHTLAYLLQEEEQGEQSAGVVQTSSRSAMGGAGLFMEWAVGKAGEIFPDGAGKLMLPDSRIRWEVHMHANGTEVADSYVELGVWFYPKDEEPEYRTRLRMFDARGRSGLDIRPGEVAVTQQFHVLRWPTRLENFQPHMHMRGKTMMIEAVYPNGRSEVLSQVDNFQWNWHVNYIYADHVAPLLPAGTTLVVTAWHDNTAGNPNNPDPEQWIGWGDRTVDEMAHAWVDVTYLPQEEFDRLIAEREAAEEQERQQQNQ